MLAIVKIMSNFGTYEGKYFGPFNSTESAAEEMRKSGWCQNINNRPEDHDVWYCQTGRHEGTTAQIVSLEPAAQLPKQRTIKSA